MKRSLRIDLRDQRLPGPKHRLEVSARTTDPAVRDARAAALRRLLDQRGRGLAILERLRARRISIEQVQRAVEAMDLSALEPTEEEVAAEVLESPRIYLGATVDRYLRSLEGRHMAAMTLVAYRADCRGIEAAFGVERDRHGAIVRDVEVASITPAQAEAWLRGPKRGGKVWSAARQKRAHTVASVLWGLAIEADEDAAEALGTERTIRRNVWKSRGERKGVRPARVRPTRFEFLSRGEAARLLRALKGTPHAALIAAGLYGGLRPGETMHLRRNVDADLAAGLLRVQPRKGLHAWQPKTDHSVRTLPLHPRLARWLRAHIALGYAGDVYLFRSPGRDHPVSPTTRERWVREAFTAAGIRYGRKKDALTQHSLRHTFASWLTQADVHPLKIARLMGDTVEVVLQTYSHLVSTDLESAIQKL